MFKFERATKNKIRLTEQASQNHPPIIGTLYVEKWWMGSAKQLTVTIDKP